MENTLAYAGFQLKSKRERIIIPAKLKAMREYTFFHDVKILGEYVDEENQLRQVIDHLP
jgi:hypothetical protein